VSVQFLELFLHRFFNKLVERKLLKVRVCNPDCRNSTLRRIKVKLLYLEIV